MSDQRNRLRRRPWTALRQHESALHDEALLGTRRTTSVIEAAMTDVAAEDNLPRTRAAALQNRDPVRRSVPRSRPAPVSSPYLTATEAAEYCRLSVKTLERYRKAGGGPRFRKGGGEAGSKTRVVYHIDDLDQWLRPMDSTSDNRHRR